MSFNLVPYAVGSSVKKVLNILKGNKENSEFSQQVKLMSLDDNYFKMFYHLHTGDSWSLKRFNKKRNKTPLSQINGEFALKPNRTFSSIIEMHLGEQLIDSLSCNFSFCHSEMSNWRKHFRMKQKPRR